MTEPAVNQENMSLGTILCVHLDDVCLEAVVEQSEGKFDIVRANYFDGDKLLKMSENAQLVFAAFDGVSGRSAPFVHNLRQVEATKDLPVFMVSQQQSAFENGTIRQDIEAQGFLILPNESFKLTSLFYSYIHPEDKGDLTEGIQGVQDPELQKFEKPVLLKEVELFDHLQKSFEKAEKHKIQLSKIPMDEVFCLDKILVFHPESAGGIGLARQLKEIRCHDVEVYQKISELFNQMWCYPVKAVVIWYEVGKSDDAIALLREINETRDLERIALVIMCPGEEALKKFAADAAGLFYDIVIMPSKFRAHLKDSLQKAFDLTKDKTTPMYSLFQLRKPWRYGTYDHDKSPLNESVLKELLTPIAKAKGKEYWVRSEAVLHHLLAGKGQMAQEEAEKLVSLFPDSLDATFLLGAVKVRNENKDAVASWIIEKALNHRDLNLEKCYQMGKTFLRWKLDRAIRELMILWYDREDLARDHQFYYTMSQFFLLTKDYKNEYHYLAAALHQCPLRGEYLVALAKNLEANLRRHGAAKIWNYAAKAYKTIGLIPTKSN